MARKPKAPKPPKPRNAAAKALADPTYRPRVAPPKKGRTGYSRKDAPPIDESRDDDA